MACLQHDAFDEPPRVPRPGQLTGEREGLTASHGQRFAQWRKRPAFAVAVSVPDPLLFVVGIDRVAEAHRLRLLLPLYALLTFAILVHTCNVRPPMKPQSCRTAFSRRIL